MADTLKYPKGSIIVMTTGAYSDYSITGFLVAVEDCDLPALAQAFAAEERARIKAGKGARSWRGKEDLDDFPSWLVAKGHCMPVAYNSVHLGDYSDWEREFGVPETEEVP